VVTSRASLQVTSRLATRPDALPHLILASLGTVVSIVHAEAGRYDVAFSSPASHGVIAMQALFVLDPQAHSAATATPMLPTARTAIWVGGLLGSAAKIPRGSKRGCGGPPNARAFE